MKKPITILIAIGLVFLLIGSVWNFQKGLTLNGDFWKFRKDGSYTHGKDSVRYNPDNRQFDIALNGRSFTAEMSEKDETLYIEFSDGWAIELGEYGMFSTEIDGILLSTDCSIIPLDFEAMGCRFEKATLVTEPIYDEYRQRVGEHHALTTESGEVFEAWETWDAYEFQDGTDADRCKARLIAEGEPVTYHDRYGQYFVNEDGEYLVNPDALFDIEYGYENLNRLHLARFMHDVADENTAMQGSIPLILLYLFFYCLGAVQWLWPEEVTFFGSRWQFRNDPELSDEGILSVRVGAVIVMIIGVAMLFLPAFAP